MIQFQFCPVQILRWLCRRQFFSLFFQICGSCQILLGLSGNLVLPIVVWIQPNLAQA